MLYNSSICTLFKSAVSKSVCVEAGNSLIRNNERESIQKDIVKLSLCLTIWALLREGVRDRGCIDPSFLDAGTSWSAPRLGRLTLGTHCVGGWMNLRTRLDDVEKKIFLFLLGLEIWPLGRPALRQSLYHLRYPSSTQGKGHNLIWDIIWKCSWRRREKSRETCAQIVCIPDGIRDGHLLNSSMKGFWRSNLLGLYN
jgi:hypothetical protein